MVHVTSAWRCPLAVRHPAVSREPEQLERDLVAWEAGEVSCSC
jgi:hypothetical protein